jgi:hypothetical protein
MFGRLRQGCLLGKSTCFASRDARTGNNHTLGLVEVIDRKIEDDAIGGDVSSRDRDGSV